MGTFGDLLARLTGRSAAPRAEAATVPAVPTAADLLAALDRVEAMVAEGAVPGPVGDQLFHFNQPVADLQVETVR